MKAKKIILLLVFIIGIIGLLLMASFTPRNACEYANSNIEYIKGELHKALLSNEHQTSKYHAFKALNGIEKTRLNFLDCGCSGTIESLEKALGHLKSATTTKSSDNLKQSLHLALENTIIGSKVLRVFEQETLSDFSSPIPIEGTNPTVAFGVGKLLPQGDLKKRVHKCLLGFECSLDKVVKEVECKEANKFITKIHEETQTTLLNTELTPAKKEYHQRVKTITQEALDKLGDCKQQ